MNEELNAKTLDQLKAEPEADIRKTFELKGTLEENCFEGTGNALGIMDRTGDVIMPGAFKSALAEFLTEGFVPVGHDWEGLPVAFPMDAKEQSGALYLKAKFHSTQAGQDARTVCKERLEAGLSVGLSVGFRPDRDRCAWFETGEALYKFCKENGLADGLDPKSIKAWKGYCRLIMGVKKLYEISIVTVPANQGSWMATAKGGTSPTDERPLAGLRLVEELNSALAAVKSVTDRLGGYMAARKAEDRPVSAERVQQAKDLHEALGTWIKAAEAEDADDSQHERERKIADLHLRSISLRAGSLRA